MLKSISSTTSMLVLTAISALILMQAPFISADNPTLKIGVLYSSIGPFASYGESQKFLGEEYAKWENEQSVALLRNARVEVESYDVKNDPIKVAEGTRYLIEQGNVSAIIAPEGDLSIYAAIASQPTSGNSTSANDNVLVLVGMSGNDNNFKNETTGKRLFKNVIGTMTPASQYFNGIYPLVARENATSLVYIYSNAPLYKLLTLGSKNYALDSDLTILGSISIPPVATPDLEYPYMLEAVKSIAQKWPQVDVLAIATVSACDTVPTALEAINFNPKAVIVWECLNNIANYTYEKQQKLRYFINPSQWNSGLTGGEFSDGVREYASMFKYDVSDSIINKVSSPMQFYNWYINSTNLKFMSVTPSSLACFYIISYAMSECGCQDRESILNFAHRTRIQSFYGWISVDSFGLNTKGMVVLQVNQNGALKIISPDTVRGSSKLIYPMPQWDERQNWFEYLNQGFGLAVLTMVIILEFGYCLVAILLFRARNTKRVKASSFTLNMIILLGCMIGTLTPLTWTSNATNIACLLRHSSLAISITITQLTIIFKSHRIHSIFSTQFNYLNITDMRIIGKLSLVVGIIVIFFIIWHGISPAYAIIKVEDLFRPSLNYKICSSNSQAGLNAVVMLYIVGLILVGLYYVKKLHMIDAKLKMSTYDYKDFQETQPILYVLLTSSVCVVIVSISLLVENRENRDIIIFARSCFILCNFFITAALMCAYRLIHRNNDFLGASYATSRLGNNNNNNNPNGNSNGNTGPRVVVSGTKQASPHNQNSPNANSINSASNKISPNNKLSPNHADTHALPLPLHTSTQPRNSLQSHDKLFFTRS